MVYRIFLLNIFVRVRIWLNNTSRITNGGGVFWDITQYNGGRSDTCAGSNGNAPQYFGSSSDQRPFADDGVSVATEFSSATEGDILEEGDIVFNDACFTYDNAGAVIKAEALSDPCGWMYVDGEEFVAAAL
ncbi:hypothetical protein AA106556_0121 [Neokomagataea tanensis NBRC 106556]|uniref:Uncharacterized protein n=1 Tax=Neokomagataea tanensis NBRC 106556 TaxID=1223519 RepID=A0ABQ0QG17_9PROT|nr:hypothetical protein AA106556_0121 [Neokomagataea tanensis NBRC 106556]